MRHCSPAIDHFNMLEGAGHGKIVLVPGEAVACADKDHFVFIPKEPPVITVHRGISRVELPVVARK